MASWLLTYESRWTPAIGKCSKYVWLQRVSGRRQLRFTLEQHGLHLRIQVQRSLSLKIPDGWWLVCQLYCFLPILHYSSLIRSLFVITVSLTRSGMSFRTAIARNRSVNQWKLAGSHHVVLTTAGKYRMKLSGGDNSNQTATTIGVGRSWQLTTSLSPMFHWRHAASFDGSVSQRFHSQL